MFFSHKTQCLRPTTPIYFVSNMGMKDHSVTNEALPVKNIVSVKILNRYKIYTKTEKYHGHTRSAK